MASEEAKKAAQKEVEKRLSPMMRALNTVREVNDKGRQAVKSWADSKTRPAPDATDTGLETVGYMVSHDAELGPVEDALVYRSQAEELLAAERAERAEREELEADNAELVADYDFMRKSRKKWKERAEKAEAKLTAAEKALEARETIISKLVKHVDALPDDAEFTGSAAKWASRLALILGELRTVPEVPTILRSKVAEYIAARDDYELATKPNGSFGTARHLKPNDPIVVRYREARAALEIKP